MVIAGDNEIGGSSERAGEHVVIIGVSRDDARHAGWCDQVGNAAQIIDEASSGESGLLKAC